MEKSTENRPSVGVAVVVVNNGQILIGRDTRKGTETYGVPGGHWESGETLRECAARETREESGIEIDTPQLISIYDFYREDKKKSYVSIGMKANYINGKLLDLHEEGRLEWAWYPPKEALTLNLFPPDRVLIERFLSGVMF